MDYEISVRDVPSQWIVSVRRQMSVPELPAFFGEAYGRIFARLAELDVAAVAPPFAIYHQFGPGQVDAEAGVPISRRIAATSPLKVRRLTAATVARTMHVGPYEELGYAYEALTDWIADHGRVTAGPVRERYLNGPGEDVPPTSYMTEIEMPVSPVAEALPV
jgi:effector-binding domain-containing protein